MEKPQAYAIAAQSRGRTYLGAYTLHHDLLIVHAKGRDGLMREDSARSDGTPPEDQARRLLSDMAERGSLD